MTFQAIIKGAKLTPEESYNIHGTFTTSQVERLLEADSRISFVENTFDGLSEGEYIPNVEEDFLSPIIDKLNILLSNLRGNNRETLKDILEDIDTLSSSVNSSLEYSNEKIRELFKQIGTI